jgi:hypothetical protein
MFSQSLVGFGCLEDEVRQAVKVWVLSLVAAEAKGGRSYSDQQN